MVKFSESLISDAVEVVRHEMRRSYPFSKVSVEALGLDQMAAFVEQEKAIGLESGRAQRSLNAINEMAGRGIEVIIFGVTIKTGNSHPDPRFVLYPFGWEDPML